MAEHVRDALLAEIRRALDVVIPEESAAMFAEIERWIPPDGALPHGPVTRRAVELLALTNRALRTAFPEEKGAELAGAMNAMAEPWAVLAETTAWCAGRPVRLLRDARFEPQPEQPGAPGVDWFLWGNDPRRAVQMANVIRQRHSALFNFPATPPLVQPDVPPGRFLVYWPDEQASDGSSQAASEGFFDIFDAPPWDTWLHYEPVHHFLVSWVPLPLVPQAAIGVERNAVDCHAWLDDIAHPDHPRHPLRLAFAPWLRTLAARPFP